MKTLTLQCNYVVKKSENAKKQFELQILEIKTEFHMMSKVQSIPKEVTENCLSLQSTKVLAEEGAKARVEEVRHPIIHEVIEEESRISRQQEVRKVEADVSKEVCPLMSGTI